MINLCSSLDISHVEVRDIIVHVGDPERLILTKWAEVYPHSRLHQDEMNMLQARLELVSSLTPTDKIFIRCKKELMQTLNNYIGLLMRLYFFCDVGIGRHSDDGVEGDGCWCDVASQWERRRRPRKISREMKENFRRETQNAAQTRQRFNILSNGARDVVAEDWSEHSRSFNLTSSQMVRDIALRIRTTSPERRSGTGVNGIASQLVHQAEESEQAPDTTSAQSIAQEEAASGEIDPEYPFTFELLLHVAHEDTDDQAVYPATHQLTPSPPMRIFRAGSELEAQPGSGQHEDGPSDVTFSSEGQAVSDVSQFHGVAQAVDTFVTVEPLDGSTVDEPLEGVSALDTENVPDLTDGSTVDGNAEDEPRTPQLAPMEDDRVPWNEYD